MTNIYSLIFMTISLSPIAMAQLPFFLQRFRPAKHSLLPSGSTSYPSFASSLFPLSSSSWLSQLYAPQNSFLGSSSLGSSPFSSVSSPFSSGSSLYSAVSSPFSSGSSSLSSGSFPFSSNSGLGSLSFASSPFTASASSLSPSHFGSSSFTSSNLGQSLLSGSNFGSPSFSNSNLGSQYGSQYNSPPRFAASNLAHSLSDLGNVNYNEGMGGIDQGDLVDDFPGFSGGGFGKDLNFAGTQSVKVQAPPQPSLYNGGNLSYLQRSPDGKK